MRTKMIYTHIFDISTGTNGAALDYETCLSGSSYRGGRHHHRTSKRSIKVISEIPFPSLILPLPLLQ